MFFSLSQTPKSYLLFLYPFLIAFSLMALEMLKKEVFLSKLFHTLLVTG